MPSGRRRVTLVVGAIAIVVLLVAIAVLVVVLDTGSDDHDESASEWAQEVCGDVQSWYDEVTSLEAFFDEPPTNGSDGLRGAVESRVDEIRSATERLVDELDATGLPDTESAREAEQIVRDLAASLERRVDRVTDAVDEARDGGLLDVFDAVTTIARELEAGRAETEDAVDQLRELDPAGEIRQALDDAPECEQLQQTLSGSG